MCQSLDDTLSTDTVAQLEGARGVAMQSVEGGKMDVQREKKFWFSLLNKLEIIVPNKNKFGKGLCFLIHNFC